MSLLDESKKILERCGQTKSSILEEVKNCEAKRVKLAIVDIDGILRGKIVHIEKFLSAVESHFGFCDVVFGWDANDLCYDNIDYTGEHTGYPDATAKIDLSSFRKIPWDEETPFFLADLENKKGEPLEISPRSLIKKLFQEALDIGYLPFFSQEFEWFNFRESSDALHGKEFLNPNPLTKGMFGYSILRSSQCASYFNDLFKLLREFRLPLEGLHTETGPGVYEAALLYQPLLEAADRATLFKSAIKEIGQKHGIIPSFMAKWNNAFPGCNGHLHQSLWDKEGKNNLFFDKDHPKEPNELLKSYLAGQLYCLPHILPMFAPTINSYKRYVEGCWAPTKATWGIDDRTVALRILLTGEKSSRIEHRVPGSDVNPYLAMAASLASGLYGIKKKLKLEIPPGQHHNGDKSALPLHKTLHEATEAMKRSELPQELFGEEFTKHFIQTREWECRQYNQAITDWEFKRYFEII